MNSTASTTVAALLRWYRAQAGFTQEELAERAGLSARAISDLERGIKRRPYPHTVRRLVEALSLGNAEATRFQTAARLPGGAANVCDRGEVALKGLAAPVRGLQIAPKGELPGELPPLQPILKIPPTNLPDDPTPFIGREFELDEIIGLLRDPRIRLVTLTGPGGTGKTRLALQVGNTLLYDYKDGVFFVSLASLSDPSLVCFAIAEVLGVKEEGDKLLSEILAQHLRDKHLLLVVDNFEHLLDACQTVADLLDGCRKAHILITSRIPLHLSREHEYPVPALTVPHLQHLPDAQGLFQYESVALFIERARAVKPGFAVTNDNAPAVAEICSRLDGLPLAIELAAARIKLFPPQALLQRLSSRLKLLTGGAKDRPDRQQTLRGAIDWSYYLLTGEEQLIFARLSIFAGGCSFDGAEAVCNPEGDLDLLEGLSSLVDKSLLRQEGDEEPRFVMLETIREYAEEKLAEGEEDERTRDAHALYFLDVAQTAQITLRGPQQGEWLARLDVELDNIRLALGSVLAQAKTDEALKLASTLFRFWLSRGYLTEGRRWLETGLQQTDRVNASTKAEAIWTLGWLAIEQCDYERATALENEALTLFREQGDGEGTVRALLGLTYIRTWEGEYERGFDLAEESLRLSQELGYQEGMAWSLLSLGVAAVSVGNVDQAKRYNEEALHLYRALGDTEHIAGMLNNLAEAAMWEGKLDEAVLLCDEGLRLVHGLRGDHPKANLLDTRGTIAAKQGEYEQAERLFRKVLLLCRKAGQVSLATFTLGNQAEAAAAQGEGRRAITLEGAATALRESFGTPLPPSYKVEREKTLVRARGLLDEEEFIRAWKRGQAMSLDAAIAYALEESGKVGHV